MTEKDFPYKLNKTVLTVSSLGDEPDEKSYWLSRTTLERLLHVEALRWIGYGDKTSARLQRFFEVSPNKGS
jgi:hypothetical protein